ncbi:Glycosylphosphatidylinositol (GPI) anchor assembly protein [Myotisia sp. PD_48]|nr:Glycosylphosphatidylinositol (GPI) anchor assembly protein [Myotisia sp. PD_48]
MSSQAPTSAVAASATSKSNLSPSPRLPPIQVLSSTPAKTYAHLHPLIVLSTYALRFRALVSDPVTGLITTLPVLVVLQILYVIVCLPTAGTSPGGGSGGASAKSRVGGKHKRKDMRPSIGSKLFPAILSVTLPLLLGTPFLSILLVLFGAPCTTHIPHTILCAAHMAVLAGTALVYVHGTDGDVWREIWGFARPLDSVWGATVGMVLGAWFGAVPIPLDWDRPWQAYPITIITGAYVGYVVGSWLARTPLLYGKRIQFAAADNVREDDV